MPPVFCFIDDAQFELDTFQANAAPAFERARFVYASTFEEAQARLAGDIPLCFLLDIYGSDPGRDDPRILEAGELAQLLGPEASLASLYEGLEQAGGDAGNLYLRRLYGQVERWQRGFLRAAAALAQGRAYGLHNLVQVRRHYPWAAALGYSRKALYADAVALSQAGAEGLLQKPQGADDQAIAQATRDAAPTLAQAAYAAVGQRLTAQAGLLLARHDRQEMIQALGATLARALGCLAGEPGRQEAGRDLQALAAAQAAGLERQDLSLLEALGLWLQS